MTSVYFSFFSPKKVFCVYRLNTSLGASLSRGFVHGDCTSIKRVFLNIEEWCPWSEGCHLFILFTLIVLFSIARRDNKNTICVWRESAPVGAGRVRVLPEWFTRLKITCTQRNVSSCWHGCWRNWVYDEKIATYPVHPEMVRRVLEDSHVCACVPLYSSLWHAPQQSARTRGHPQPTPPTHHTDTRTPQRRGRSHEAGQQHSRRGSCAHDNSAQTTGPLLSWAATFAPLPAAASNYTLLHSANKFLYVGLPLSRRGRKPNSVNED